MKPSFFSIRGFRTGSKVELSDIIAFAIRYRADLTWNEVWISGYGVEIDKNVVLGSY